MIPCPLSSTHLLPQTHLKFIFTVQSKTAFECADLDTHYQNPSLHHPPSPHCRFPSFSKSQEHNMLTLLPIPRYMLFSLLRRPPLPMSTNQIHHHHLDNCCSCFGSQLRCYLLWKSFLVPARLFDSFLVLP